MQVCTVAAIEVVSTEGIAGCNALEEHYADYGTGIRF